MFNFLTYAWDFSRKVQVKGVRVPNADGHGQGDLSVELARNENMNNNCLYSMYILSTSIRSIID